MSIARMLRKLLRHDKGSSDMTVTLLLTAAGAAMVGLTVPSMFRSSETAQRTFDQQVRVLEQGANGGAAGAGAGGLSGIPGGIGAGGLPSLPTPPAFDFGNIGKSGSNGGNASNGNNSQGTSLTTPNP